MKQFEIENIKKFTGALFTGEAFDNFCVTEASFSTLIDVTIDGHINNEFLEESRKAPQSAGKDWTVRWKKIKPLCFDIIKGQRVPLKFKIVFMMPRAGVSRFIDDAGAAFKEDQVNGLFMNVRYEAGRLDVITGTSLKEFSLDKSLEEAWDARIGKFMNEITD